MSWDQTVRDAMNFSHAPSSGKGVVVAVIDVGADLSHRTLKDNIIASRNFIKDDAPVEDFSPRSHGTHSAGLALTVSPHAKLIICKSLGDDGKGSFDTIIRAVDWCTQWRGPEGERVHVISSSFGSRKSNRDLQNAIRRARDAGITFVCAASNWGDDDPETDELAFPAMYSETISVGACTLDGKVLLPFSNTNKEVDVLAPGWKVTSTARGGEWSTSSGTSVSCPLIAGAVACYVGACLREGRLPSPAEVSEWIKARKEKPPKVGMFTFC